MTTPVLGLSEIAEGVASQAALHNTALRQIEARSIRVLSRTTDTPAVSPTESDSYILPVTATGVWASRTDQIASWIGGAWSYHTPGEGVCVWVNDEDAMLVFDGATWDSLVGASAYDVGGGYAGVPVASAVLMRYPFPRAVTFPADMTASQGVAGTAATATADFDLQKNGVSFGTMRFEAAGTTATFIPGSSPASATSFVAGDVLLIEAPASPDATLADIGFALAGARA